MRRIFGTSEARNLKFGVRIDPSKSHLTDDIMSAKRAWSGSRGRIFNLKPFHKSGTGEARNFKFGTRIDLGKTHLKHDKIPPKRA